MAIHITTLENKPHIAQIPYDCIKRIAQLLDGDVSTLFQLLQVSSAFFNAALPVIYRDPFRALDKQIYERSRRDNTSAPYFKTSLPAKKLLYILILSCRQSDDLAPFLTPDWPDPISPFAECEPLRATYIDYVQDMFYDHWRETLKCLAPEISSAVEQMFMRKLRLLFLDHHKERIQKLYIPVTHLNPYYEYIPYLKNLQSIEFYVDELDGSEDPPLNTTEQEVQVAENNTDDNNEIENNEVNLIENEINTDNNNNNNNNPVTDDENINIDTLGNDQNGGNAENIMGNEDLVDEGFVDNETDTIGGIYLHVNANGDREEDANDESGEIRVEEGVESNEDGNNIDEGGEAVSNNGEGSSNSEGVVYSLRVLDSGGTTEDRSTEVEVIANDNNGAGHLGEISTTIENDDPNTVADNITSGNNAPDTYNSVNNEISEPQIVIQSVDADINNEVNNTNNNEVNTNDEGGEASNVEVNVNTENTDGNQVNQVDVDQEVLNEGNNDGQVIIENQEVIGGEHVVVEVEQVVVAVLGEQEGAGNQEVGGGGGGGGGGGEGEGENNNETNNEVAPQGPIYDPVPNVVAFLEQHRSHFNPSRVYPSSNPHYSWNPKANRYPTGYGLVQVHPPYAWISNGSNDTGYMKVLEALESPAYINLSDWTQAARYLENIPLDGIKLLRTVCNDIPGVRWEQKKLLQSCRSLERFSARLCSADDFKWALEEKKEQEIFKKLLRGKTSRDPDLNDQGNGAFSPLRPGYNPVPLRKVTLASREDAFFIPVLQDICYAFNETLESIRVRMYNRERLLPTRIFYKLSFLTVLDIVTESDMISSGLFLEACPSLCSLRVVDTNQSHDSIIDASIPLQRPWYLPRLRVLNLEGTICNTFNLDTLSSTHDIEIIRLEGSMSNLGVLNYSDNYIEHFTNHSWNWDLPKLRKISMKGHFAHLFQFCFLEGCPRLQVISLDLDRVHRNMIVTNDIPNPSASFRASAVSLTLKGRWILKESEDLFHQLIQLWFSSVQYLKLDASEFPSSTSIVKALKHAKYLKKAIFRRHKLSDYDAWESGLEKAKYKCSTEWDTKNRYKVSITDAAKRRVQAFNIRQQERIQKRTERKVRETEDALRAERARKFFQDPFDVLPSAIPTLNIMYGIDINFFEEQSQIDVDMAQQIAEDNSSNDKVNMEEQEEKQWASEDKLLEEQGKIRDLEIIDKPVYVFKGIRYQTKCRYPLTL